MGITGSACREVDMNRSTSTRSPEPASGGREPGSNGRADSGGILASIQRRAVEGLRLLAEAHRYARELERSTWDFALELDALQAAGCTLNELRWLVCKGYVAHAAEITEPGESSRTFHRVHTVGLKFGRRTCFVLTEAGIAFAAGLIDCPSLFSHASAAESQTDDSHAVSAADPVRPRWDRDRQELRLGYVVVKQYKVPAPNQERVLAAFEEEGWPVHVDDPLPPSGELDPKRRLHDTINSLNRNQKAGLIRFSGDGSGEGIRWELIAEPRKNGKPGNGRPV
jgi:hypothetical protein